MPLNDESPLPAPTNDELWACEHYYERWAEAEKSETNTRHAGSVAAFRAGWKACIESEDRARALTEKRLEDAAQAALDEKTEAE